MSENMNLELMCEVHVCSELLPLYCKDCDCLLCGDCVTRDHVGHKIRKASEVVESQELQLKESLSNDKSILFLQKLLNNSKRSKKQLAENRENLLRNVVNREEEIIEKVKLWREEMTEKIIYLADIQTECLIKGIALTSVLLQSKDSGLNLKKDYSSVEIIFLNHGLRNLLEKGNRNWYNNWCLGNLNFKIGIVAENIFDLFGKLVDETEELSSDINQNEEKEEEKEKLYGSFGLKIMKFKFASGPVNNIIPVRNLLLRKEKIAFYDFDVKKGTLNHRMKNILSNVHQIALIPSCGDVLTLMNSFQRILRITKGGMVTTYISTKIPNESYCCVGNAGKQAYACVVHVVEKNSYWTTKLSLLDQYGRILMSFTLLDISKCINKRIFVSDEANKFVTIDERTVKVVECTRDIVKVIKAYRGCVGTSPAYSFSPRDIAVDMRGNILVAVFNDNAIHLLDQTLTFQKLLMTAEDGLQRPTSVALDAEGYLYVGCEDGQIHVMNYQYLLNTNRQTRLEIEHSK